MTREEWIRALRKAGRTLIPLNGKIPVEKNWPKTPKDKFDEKNLTGNYGILLEKTDLVIDIDPRNFPDGDDVFSRFCKDFGFDFSRTLVVKTGGDGNHIHLKKPADIDIVGGLKEYPGIEFKGAGKQVVGPGSIHPDTGREYFVVRGTPANVADAPQKLLEIIAKKKVEHLEKRTGTEGYQDDSGTQKRYADYLKLLHPAIQGERGDDQTFVAACRGRDLGLRPDLALALLSHNFNSRCQPPWSEDELRDKVENAYRYARGAVGNAHPAATFDEIKQEPAQLFSWKTKKEGGRDVPVKCFQNVLNYFEIKTTGLKGIFAFNEFARRVEFIKSAPWHGLNGDRPKTGSPVDDADLSKMRAMLARPPHGYDANPGDLIDAMIVAAHEHKYHPVRSYLNSLRWDGKRRLNGWLVDYLGVEDEPYVRAVGRKTLCAAVARIYEPGCKFDHVLVLEGSQGIGKSGICRILGGEWFADFRLSVENKDTIQMMQGKWIVEMADLHIVRQAEIDSLKSFLTRQVDEARFAYGRLPALCPRQGVFIGTFNPGPDGTYLKDDTGNRRWWPVHCQGMWNGKFNFAGLASARDQLFAEAVYLYKQGEVLTMDTLALQDAAEKAQAERHGEHPWIERLSEWLEEQDKSDETRKDFYTPREIWVNAMNGLDARFSRREQLDCARAMRDLKWEPGIKRVSSAKIVRGYWRPRIQKTKTHAEAAMLDGFV